MESRPHLQNSKELGGGETGCAMRSAPRQAVESDQLRRKLKSDVADLVEANPSMALNAHKRSSFDALIQALKHQKMQAVVASKK